MLLDVYLIRDPEYNTLKLFTSEVKAKNFMEYNRKSEVERVEIDIPYAAMEIHRVKSTKKRTELIQEVKTLQQLTDEHIEHVYVYVCERNIKKAAKVLNMNARILKMEIARLIKD
jgi:ubiquinone/menaquinone biosynthesis C-methylase UbiE